MKSIALYFKACGRRADAAGDLSGVKSRDDLRTAAERAKLNVLGVRPIFFQSAKRPIGDRCSRAIGTDNFTFQLLDVFISGRA